MHKKYDVVVAGGGISGISAAVTSAKKGLKVLLIEQSAMLGGMGTSGLITMIMSSRFNFYGLGKEFIDSLISKGGARYIENPAVKGYNYYPFDAEAMKRELDALVFESGAEVLFHTKVIGAKKRCNLLGIQRLILLRLQVLVDFKVFALSTVFLKKR
jgi:flavin-dependent dehydrogenase